MNQIHIEQSAVIAAAPAQLYAVIRDYEVGHLAILPKPYFQEMIVEEGGQGAGTKTRLKMKIMGQEFNFRHEVSEPEPGRILKETDRDTGLATTFTFEPLAGGTQTRLTITTDTPVRPGLAGFLERFMSPLILRRIYRQELQNLADYVRQR
ncbi:MAG: SRPBCC family protein [Chloroflexi bacterium]|nr:SRPBCC family protein [Chloroflexota bacterium]MBP8059159.1 SRPBCC family protein [Chloroflexota bacterium]